MNGGKKVKKNIFLRVFFSANRNALHLVAPAFTPSLSPSRLQIAHRGRFGGLRVRSLPAYGLLAAGRREQRRRQGRRGDASIILIDNNFSSSFGLLRDPSAVSLQAGRARRMC